MSEATSEYEVRPVAVRANGLSFDGLIAGPEGGELVVLLHGFPQFADLWLPVMRALASAGYRVLAVDQRGYSPGARPLEVEAYAMRWLVADVLAIADELGAESFHLVGHDWGGLVTWQIAADHPQRLRTVSVLSTPHTSAFQDALRGDLDQMNKSKYMLLFKAPQGIAETALLAFHAKALRAAYQGKVCASQVESNVRRLSAGGGLTAALNWYRALSPAARAGRIRVPTLYVWGEEDVALGETAALGTAAYIDAPYRFERVPGGSHWLVDEDPEHMAMLLSGHLRACI